MTPRPAQLSLREMLLEFIRFRVGVVRAKLLFEKRKLEERIHLLDGLALVFDVLDEVIKIVRKSDGRSDAAQKLQARFKLSELQAFFIVDLRIYQLSRTSISEIENERKEKKTRVQQIEKIVSSEAKLKEEVATDLKRVSEEYGDSRRCSIVTEFEEVAIDQEEYLQHEEVHVIVSKDGWLKRIRSSNDPETTRLREGDSIQFTEVADTRDMLAVISSLGNLYTTSVYDISATSGYGEPIQKLFRFEDGEQIAACLLIRREEVGNAGKEILVFSKGGIGFRLGYEHLVTSKKAGKRLMKLADGDTVSGIAEMSGQLLLLLSAQGYGLLIASSEVPTLASGSKGVILQKMSGGDELVLAGCFAKQAKVQVRVDAGGTREIELKGLTIAKRSNRGDKVVKRGRPEAFLIEKPKGGAEGGGNSGNGNGGKSVQLRLV